MTIDEALNFIHNPRWRGAAADLSRVRGMLEALGNPQNRLCFVHVAGTNGKGSVCSLLASVLRCAGYRTGLYTSPYLHRWSERIRVDGAPISDVRLCEAASKVAPVAAGLKTAPTEFELVTVIAFLYFAQMGCDIVVLETGIGGRLDPTNVIGPPECAVITNIGLDHTQLLGGTIEAIASEKAGIIKAGAVVAAYKSAPGAMAVIERACAEKSVPLAVANFEKLEPIGDSLSGQTFRYGQRELFIPLLGAHQQKNAAVAIEALDILRDRGFEISESAIKAGFETVRWPGRFELLGKKPYFIVDGGHNAQCAAAIRSGLLRYFPDRKRVLLAGMMKDKDAAAFARELVSACDEVVCVTVRNPRSMDAGELAEVFKAAGRPAQVCGDAGEGIALAASLAGDDGAVCAAGSLYLAGEVRERLGFVE